VPGQRNLDKFGANLDVDAGSPADVWMAANLAAPQLLWVAPTVAQAHTLTSTSAQDDIAGTGMRVARLEGLLAGFVEDSEDVEMGGLGGAVTTKEWLRLNRAYGVEWGPSGEQLGDIDVTANIDGTVSLGWLAEWGQTEQAIYSTPVGVALLVSDFYASLIRAGANGGGQVAMRLRENAHLSTAGWRTIHTRGFGVGHDLDHEFQSRYIPPRSDVLLRIINVTTANMIVSAGFAGRLVRE